MGEEFVLMNLSKYKGWRALLHRMTAKQQSKREQLILYVYTQWKSAKRWRALIYGMITKQQVKNEQIKRKKTCPLCFVNLFKFQENKFQNSKEFVGKKIKNRFLGKAAGHNDHDMINVGGQRPKIGGN